MVSLISLLGVFVLVLLLSKRWNLGYALFAGSVVLAVFTRTGGYEFLRSLYRVFVERDSLGLIANIMLILVLSEALKAGGQLDRLVSESKKIFHDLRLTVFVLPALVGFLPMPGGAHFSAPMVDSVFKDIPISRERKSFANYWFRHVWEYVMPIYPGIVATAALTGIELSHLIRVNVFLSFAAISVGLVMTFGRGAGARSGEKQPYGGSVKSVLVFIRELSPVLGVVAMAGIFGVDLNLALLVGIAAALLLAGKGFASGVKSFKAGLKIDVLIMLLGILFFRNIISVSGVVDDIALFMHEHDIGVIPVVFGLSILSGFVTGITIAFVGITLPIVLSMIDATPASMMFIFASGFAGVLLSPVHLCLVLSNRYFGAGLLRMYLYLIPSVIIVILTGAAGYFFFG